MLADMKVEVPWTYRVNNSLVVHKQLDRLALLVVGVVEVVVVVVAYNKKGLLRPQACNKLDHIVVYIRRTWRRLKVGRGRVEVNNNLWLDIAMDSS